MGGRATRKSGSVAGSTAAPAVLRRKRSMIDMIDKGEELRRNDSPSDLQGSSTMHMESLAGELTKPRVLMLPRLSR